ncbi:hypothetical protein TMPK1_30130 [Rhodospirillales bacterium TMPK1]|uniref:Uncharacterized protein n=1 Tax=Roseiterribacter gracilis TaxID=2812848 RepID=A0A8S8XHP5_9PROT|nr:hypothetical protein TMPK1_30130 [Rhodospirillales bacterium TMPK1]
MPAGIDETARLYVAAIDANDLKAAAAVADGPELYDPYNVAKLRSFTGNYENALDRVYWQLRRPYVDSADPNPPPITTLTYQRQRRDDWLAIHLMVRGEGDAARIVSINVESMARPLPTGRSFRFDGMQARDWINLASLLVAIAATIWGLTSSVRRPPTYRWFWRVVLVIGLVQPAFSDDLRSFGTAFLNPGMFQFTHVRSPVELFSIQFWVPLGAILFLLFRRYPTPFARPRTIEEAA